MASAIFNFFLPSLCPRCHEAPGPILCLSCHDALPRIAHPCSCCGATRLSATAPCHTCDDRGLAHIDRVHAAMLYVGTASELIGNAKAGAKPAAIAALSVLLPLPETPIHAIIPVPPSPGRRPGPHLATACARWAAHQLKVPCLHILRCTRHAREQHRLSRADRARNVSGLFTCRGTAPERVLLVDDILTSGATASAAAAALRQAGARRIIATFLCRTP